VRALETFHIEFSSKVVTVRIHSDYGVLRVGILCTVSEWQLSSLERLHLVLASCLHVERPPHTRGFISETTLARQCREHVLAGTFTSVCCCEESLHMQDIYSPYCARPARACRGKNDKSFAHPGEYSLGRVSAAGTPPRGHRKVRWLPTAHQSPCSSSSLGQGFGFEIGDALEDL